jgi:hypothetical protein
MTKSTKASEGLVEQAKELAAQHNEHVAKLEPLLCEALGTVEGNLGVQLDHLYQDLKMHLGFLLGDAYDDLQVNNPGSRAMDSIIAAAELLHINLEDRPEGWEPPAKSGA